MLRLLPLALILATPALAQDSPAAQAWWRHVEVLAADDMEGREAGSAGYGRAAAYVVEQLKALGLEPAGSRGFEQPVMLERQTILPQGSAATLLKAGTETPLIFGSDLVVTARGFPKAGRFEGPLVFVGYGLKVPSAGLDDFRDVRGRIAVYFPGVPAGLSDAQRLDAFQNRARDAYAAGAIGMIALPTQEMLGGNWKRMTAAAAAPGMYLAEPGLRAVPGRFLDATLDPARADPLLAGSGRTLAQIAAQAAAGGLDHFAIGSFLRATVAARVEQLPSLNVVARLPGTDPSLKAEHVVLSAHLDGNGIGAPENGDRIYNGALDNAGGVATLLEIAAKLRRDKARPRRSLLFVFVTAEEKGLLGSEYFAKNPTVPRASIVANLNFDMPLQLWPLKSIFAFGAEESTLGDHARAEAAARRLAVVADPYPERNSFVRSDQFSFIRNGIPALAFKFGYTDRDGPEAKVDLAWRASRYDQPDDDVQQPGVFKEDAVRLNEYVAALALRIADAAARPEWLPTSPFRRYAAP